MKHEPVTPNYGIRISWSAEDEAFIATVPEFEGISAFGSTREEAGKEFEVVLSLVIAEYRENGWELPKPFEPATYSGKWQMRMPKSMHSQLSERAKAEGVSLAQLACTYIAQGLGRDEAIGAMKDEVKEVISMGTGLSTTIDQPPQPLWSPGVQTNKTKESNPWLN